MSDCVFCKIISGEIPSYKIYEDDKYLAFLDISQVNDGHTLLIPKNHVRWVWDIEEIGEFYELAQKIALKMREVTGNEFVYSQTVGEMVEHAHLHLVPNTEGGLREVLDKWGEALKKRKVESDKMKELVNKFKI